MGHRSTHAHPVDICMTWGGFSCWWEICCPFQKVTQILFICIFLPVCHCLGGILEAVLGRWISRFMCQKEAKLDMLASSLRMRLAAGHNLILLSPVHPTCVCWNTSSAVKCVIGFRRWNHFQGLGHLCRKNVSTDLLCQHRTGLPFPSWWIQARHYSGSIPKQQAEVSVVKAWVSVLVWRLQLHSLPGRAIRLEHTKLTDPGAIHSSCSQMPAVSLASSLSSQSSITRMQQKGSCFAQLSTGMSWKGADGKRSLITSCLHSKVLGLRLRHCFFRMLSWT